MDIYNYISNSDESIPNFMRIAVANQLAIDGPDWMFWYKEYNTGTYNSQWMILDYKKFENDINKYKLSE